MNSLVENIWIVLKVIGCMAFLVGVVFAFVWAAISKPEEDDDERGM